VWRWSPKEGTLSLFILAFLTLLRNLPYLAALCIYFPTITSLRPLCCEEMRQRCCILKRVLVLGVRTWPRALTVVVEQQQSYHQQEESKSILYWHISPQKPLSLPATDHPHCGSIVENRFSRQGSSESPAEPTWNLNFGIDHSLPLVEVDLGKCPQSKIHSFNTATLLAEMSKGAIMSS
jgi:hypothetical protein